MRATGKGRVGPLGGIVAICIRMWMLICSVAVSIILLNAHQLLYVWICRLFSQKLKGISNKLKTKNTFHSHTHTRAHPAHRWDERKKNKGKTPKTFIKLEDILLKFIHICFLLRTALPHHFPPPLRLRAHFCFVCWLFYFDAFSVCFFFLAHFCPIFCAWPLKNYKQMVRHKIRHLFCLYFLVFVFRALVFYLQLRLWLPRLAFRFMGIYIF